MICNVALETQHDPSNEVLYLTFGLVVVSSHGDMINDQTDSDCSEELGHKLPSVFGQEIGRNTLRDDPIPHKSDPYLR